jgi:hypothetical protein
MSASHTFQPEIGSDTHDFPFITSAGMGLFHFNNIVHFKIHINTCLILKTGKTLPDKNITPTTNVIDVIIISDIEASDGFEPTIRVLQTHALPLG